MIQGIIGGSSTGGGAALSSSYRNVVSTTTPTTLSGIIPMDNTIPQNTEGAEWTALNNTYVVKNAASTLRITLHIPMYDLSTVTPYYVVALFRDSGTDAIATATLTQGAVANLPNNMVPLIVEIPANTAGSTTFKVRIGSSAAATVYLLQRSSGAVLGGTARASLTVQEILP